MPSLSSDDDLLTRHLWRDVQILRPAAHLALSALAPQLHLTISATLSVTQRSDYERPLARSACQNGLASAFEDDMPLSTTLVETVDWVPVHGAGARIDDQGELVMRDSTRANYHLLRCTDRRARGALVRLQIVARPTDQCDTNLYVHHWGYRDVCSVDKDGSIVLNEGTEDIQVRRLADGYLSIDVTFRNDHETLSIGTGKPRGHYAGSGAEQYVFRSIRVELLPLNPVRKKLVNQLWRGNDPFSGFPGNLFEDDPQGWNSRHEYLSDAVALLRPSVIVEVGVWKGASTIFMAKAAKALGLRALVIAVDTWLGSSELWLSERHYSGMSFLNGYPAIYQKFLSNVIRAEVSDLVLPMPIASIGAAEILRSLAVTADLIHVDGAHDYDSVSTDLRAWWPILAPGGMLVGDDYAPDGGIPSVRRAFDDFFGPLGLSIESAGEKCRIRKPADAQPPGA